MTQPKLTQADERDRQVAALRERLSRLSDASLRINESLDPGGGAAGRAGRGALPDRRGLLPSSPLWTLPGRWKTTWWPASSDGDAERLWLNPDGPRLFEYMNDLPGSLRCADLAELTRGLGLPEFRPPVPVNAFMAAPILYQGARVGNIYVATAAPGWEFTSGG